MADALGEPQLLAEAQARAQALRECVARVLACAADDAAHDAHVRALAAEAERHVAWQRDRVFNRAAACGLDRAALARRLALRREELLSVADVLREHTLASTLA